MNGDEIVEELSDFVRMLARESTRDPATQDDYVQEALIVCVDVAIRYHRLHPQEILLVAKRAARNRIIDLIRRTRVREAVERQSAKRESYDPMQTAEARDLLDFVKGKLSPPAREVVELTEEGFDANDIALITGKGRATVYRYLNPNYLRRCL